MDGIHFLNLLPNCQNNFMFYSKDHELSVSVYFHSLREQYKN